MTSKTVKWEKKRLLSYLHSVASVSVRPALCMLMRLSKKNLNFLLELKFMQISQLR